MSSAPPLDRTVSVKLSVMMFLQYAIWGAWLPLFWPFLAGHRGLEPAQIGAPAVGAPSPDCPVCDRRYGLM